MSWAAPINDTFGYTLDVNLDEFDGPDEWVSTEGFDVGGTDTEYFSGKLTFAPNDRLSGEIRAMTMDTDDDMTLRYYIDAAEWRRCTDFDSPNAMGVRWIRGTFDCDPSPPADGIPTNTDTAAPFVGTPDELLASSYRIEPTVLNTRDRVQGEFNLGFDRGDLQFLTFLFGGVLPALGGRRPQRCAAGHRRGHGHGDVGQSYGRSHRHRREDGRGALALPRGMTGCAGPWARPIMTTTS